MNLILRAPLIGSLWGAALERGCVPEVLGVLLCCTLVVLGILWTTDGPYSGPYDFVYFREPFCGLSPNQVRAGLTLMLPVTFHLSPLILAAMILYHAGRAARHLARVLVGSETDL